MSNCAVIETIIPTSTWRIEALEVSLAVVFGVILGVILAVIITRCFVKELAKDRVHRHQDDVVIKNAAYENRVAGYAELTYRNTQKTTVTDKTTHLLIRRDGDYEEDQEEDKKGDDSEAATEEGYLDETLEATSAGIIIALTKPSSEKTLVELSLQDFQSTKSLEKELLLEREWVFIHLLRILFGKFVAAEELDEKYAAEFVENISQELVDARQALMGSQMMQEDEIRRSSELKDSLAMEEAIENSRLGCIRRMDGLVQDAQIKVKDKLSKDSGLTSEEIEAIMKKLLENMASAEKMIGHEQNRQATILQERLAKRHALSEQYAHVTTRENKGNQARSNSLRETAKYLAEERDLTQSQADSIMKEYEEDLEKIQANHQEAVRKQSQQLADKLQRHRERKLWALEQKHSEDRERLAAKAPSVVKPSDFVEAHHDLLEQQRNEENDLVDELDYHEAEELSLLRKNLEEERSKCLAEKDESAFEKLIAKAQLSEREAEKIVKKHQSNVKAYEEQLGQEKQRQNALLQEKIALRKAAWEEEQRRTAAEQQQLAEQQERTISKLIDTQSTLDEDAKKQIMLQHEQNVSALNNHLQMTKLKQQKLLEAKLARRHARYDALKVRHEEERKGDDEDVDKDSELRRQQRVELEAEEDLMREEQQAALLSLRKQLGEETERVLKEQDAKMGVLIGKLQAGQARRQGVIKKLDKAVKDLQDQLVDSIADSNVVSERKSEHILATHMQEMDEIEEKLRQARAHQEDKLQHKMETIKLMREKTLADELKKKEEPHTDHQQSNVSKKSVDGLQFMARLLDDNRQRQAMLQLEQEMKVEALRQKDELNKQIEEALEKELKERERDFLGQLAALSQLSKEELNNMVQTAIADEGGDEADMKRLSKDLDKRMKNAKTRPDRDADGGGIDEDGGDGGGGDVQRPRKKKGGKGKKRGLNKKASSPEHHN